MWDRPIDAHWLDKPMFRRKLAEAQRCLIKLETAATWKNLNLQAADASAATWRIAQRAAV